jgi:ABC-2 type transport system ATP-binding protein
VRAFIRSYNERFGATVLLTSHYMDDVTALCPRVIVIDRGRLLYDGSLAKLAHEVRPDKRLTLRFASPVGREALDALGGRVVSLGEARLDAVLQLGAGAVRGAVERALSSLPIEDFKLEDAPLEEVLSDLFARGAAKRDGAAPA